MSRSSNINVCEYSHNNVYVKTKSITLSGYDPQKSSWRDLVGKKYDDISQKMMRELYTNVENAWKKVVKVEQPDAKQVFYQSRKEEIEKMRAEIK